MRLLTATGAQVGVWRGLPALFGVARGHGRDDVRGRLRIGHARVGQSDGAYRTEVVWRGGAAVAGVEDRDGGRHTARGSGARGMGFFGAAAFPVDQSEVVAGVSQRRGDVPGRLAKARWSKPWRLARSSSWSRSQAASRGWRSGQSCIGICAPSERCGCSTGRWGCCWRRRWWSSCARRRRRTTSTSMESLPPRVPALGLDSAGGTADDERKRVDSWGVDWRAPLGALARCSFEPLRYGLTLALAVVAVPATQTFAAPGCSVTYTVVNQWNNTPTSGGFQTNLAITNSGTTTFNGWSLTFAFPNGQSITGLWNAAFTQSGANVTVSSNQTWNQTIAPGGG